MIRYPPVKPGRRKAKSRAPSPAKADRLKLSSPSPVKTEHRKPSAPSPEEKEKWWRFKPTAVPPLLSKRPASQEDEREDSQATPSDHELLNMVTALERALLQKPDDAGDERLPDSCGDDEIFPRELPKHPHRLLLRAWYIQNASNDNPEVRRTVEAGAIRKMYRAVEEFEAAEQRCQLQLREETRPGRVAFRVRLLERFDLLVGRLCARYAHHADKKDRVAEELRLPQADRDAMQLKSVVALMRMLTTLMKTLTHHLLLVAGPADIEDLEALTTSGSKEAWAFDLLAIKDKPEEGFGDDPLHYFSGGDIPVRIGNVTYAHFGSAVHSVRMSGPAYLAEPLYRALIAWLQALKRLFDLESFKKNGGVQTVESAAMDSPLAEVFDVTEV
uniref:Uncharacterized protein n=1 Tax=Phaeomonas parva TaxID=124430 RepID=A0A7S1U620_9STRA|mmetsp:Transcript_33336/g.105367  ORF Transcript_33336/g.105367 Transcript_33336/m.105367 type:complete len:387 (+) Transcript_33336:215-1375(+)